LDILYNAEVSNSGRHIVVYGPTGSGKSTLAAQIAQRIGVPHIELDAIFWKPDWVESSPEEFRTNVVAALDKCTDGWVCDGNYSQARDLILPLTDTVVWWRPPFWVAFLRLLKRTIARAWDGKLMWGTNRETWRQSFFSRNSIILYQVTHWRKYGKIGKNLEEIPHRAIIIQLRTQREVDAFLSGLR
jgi:adenylate kinase family enzyme